MRFASDHGERCFFRLQNLAGSGVPTSTGQRHCSESKGDVAMRGVVEVRDGAGAAHRPRALGVRPATSMEPAFSCAWSHDGSGTAWVWPVGELDVATVPALDKALIGASREARLTLLDLRGVSFLDAAGVHLIVDACVGASLAGRRLLVIRGTARVHHVFTSTGMADRVDMVDWSPRLSVAH